MKLRVPAIVRSDFNVAFRTALSTSPTDASNNATAGQYFIPTPDSMKTPSPENPGGSETLPVGGSESPASSHST